VRESQLVAFVPPDYDSNPERWRSWESPRDVHEIVAREVAGPILDAGCGEGRLASLLDAGVSWIGVDSSASLLAANTYRPVVQADMRALPFRDASFREVTHLWCLYHVEDPVAAIAEAKRVLRPDGRYYSSTAARDNDPEIVPEGHPGTSFDAEEAVSLVGCVFEHVEPERWDGRFFPLSSREEVRAYCRHNYIPAERAESAEVPLWLTKRGVLVRARKT
jgi:SAM-dependent methyltransferase